MSKGEQLSVCRKTRRRHVHVRARERGLGVSSGKFSKPVMDIQTDKQTNRLADKQINGHIQ